MPQVKHKSKWNFSLLLCFFAIFKRNWVGAFMLSFEALIVTKFARIYIKGTREYINVFISVIKKSI